MPKRRSAPENQPPSTPRAKRSATAKKTAATVLRHKQERRAESLRQIDTDRRGVPGDSSHVRR